MKTSLLTLNTLIAVSTALTAAEWRKQSIYQVVTDRFARTDLSTTATCNTGDAIYCGGTWQGLIQKLDYIKNMGFSAVWISPVVEQLQGTGGNGEGQAYHGYWAQNINALNSKFGTADDLKNLSDALHAKGMYLMVDVVTNHMAYVGCMDCVDYSVFTPFNSQSYYHAPCTIDYSGSATNIQQCWEGDDIVSLPDLRTEDDDVLDVWKTWVTNLVDTYGIDGLRIDSAQQVDYAFWAPFAEAAGVYMVGEVYNGDPNYVCPYQNYLNVLNYPTYYTVTAAFGSTSGSMSDLANGINQLKSTCSDTTLLGSFLENHDRPRFASITEDFSLAKNAIAFTILQDGIPIIYQGQEQHYDSGGVPFNRDAIWFSKYSTTATLYTWISAVNQIRNQAIYKDSSYLTYKAYPLSSDSNSIVMRKGSTGSQVISVFTNLGANGAAKSLTLSASNTGFTAGQAVTEIGGCTAHTADSNGNLAITLTAGLPGIYFPTAGLTGSGVCNL